MWPVSPTPPLSGPCASRADAHPLRFTNMRQLLPTPIDDVEVFSVYADDDRTPHRDRPWLLANMIASLDIISNGRLELGLGAAWSREECDAYGIHLGSLTERFDRFDEACAVIHGLLTQETTTFSGKHFTLKNARCNPKPLQQPLPRWCIGGNGDTRTLPNVVKYASHWNYAGYDLEGFISKRAELHRQCRAAGRDPASIMTSVHQEANPDQLEALTERIQAFRAAGLDLMIFYIPPPHETTILDRLAALAERA